ncbi:cholesterol 7-desaturase nvd-like [Ixodes scapularis]|uniref:cholesterol 7-desaturase nvd-like n=1 Tax=Ixodes scapularis TaxID=6945 RepID=UPI001A9FBBB7|nr:cholesterol 7-desaturase nvd-like [Ixodes scapularis]
MTDKQPTTVKEWAELLADLSMKMDAINNKVSNELEGMSKSMGFMNENFDEFKTKVKNNTKVLKQLNTEYLELKNKTMSAPNGCLELVAFRTRDGVACVADAYCPHLGAHLGAVGRVVGDCIECPYHGWRFSGTTGACTHAPFAPKVPEFVKLKKWEVHEVLGFVFVWHHAEGEEPSWRIEDIPQITKGDWKLFFRHEHRVSILGKRWPVLRTIAETQNIGPALILEHARSKFGTARVVIAILPEEPLQMRVIQRMHFEPDAWWFFRYFLSKAHISQFRRDISIMNTKTLIEHPPLQPIDMKILEFRKWFSQFLSENSPTWQTVRERTLQW